MSLETSQDSIVEPPLKKQRVAKDSASSQISNQEIIQLSSQLISSTNSDKQTTVIIKKGDKIQRRISQLLKILVDKKEAVLLISSGDSIQKLLSILEILKDKLHNEDAIKFEQFNKLDKYETFQKKSVILEKKFRVPVFYSLIRSKNDEVEGLNSWTRQEI